MQAHAATLEEPSWRLAAHAGWWDAGFDVTTPQGVFLGVGVPWVLYLPVFRYSGQKGSLAFDASAGYRFPLSERTSLDAKLLTVWEHGWGDPCGTGCTNDQDRLFFFPVAAFRHRFFEPSSDASGVLLGVDLTPAVLSLRKESGSDWHWKNLPPWVGVAFSQAYVGYEW